MLNTTQGKLLNAVIKQIANIKEHLVTINSSFRLTSYSHTVIAIISSALITGCSVTPTSIVNQPTTARAPQLDNKQNNNGSIYSASSYRPIFEDRRPRFIGDIVTINITENTTATKENGSSASKEGEANFNTDVVPNKSNVFGKLISKLPLGDFTNFSASSDNSYSDDAAANARNVFNGSITTTVIDVLPNGNLVVSGEKQVSLDKGTEFIRFSGVINPDTITLGNTVPSTKVADARIEYRTNSKIDGAAIASIFARFFLSMSPW